MNCSDESKNESSCIKDLIKKYRFTRWIRNCYWFSRFKLENFTFNFFRLLRVCRIYDPDYSQLAQLKNMYSGKRCFIIATGPSLRSEDILALRNEYTFTMNAMCLKYEELKWTPTFYVIQDVAVFQKLKDNIHNPNIKYIFVDGRHKKHCIKHSNWRFFPRLSSYNSYDAYFRNIYKAKFSNDIHSVVYDGFTVTCSAIQIAAYMGFKEIYLLGCDCGYSEDKSKRYFVDHGVVAKHLDTSTERMFEGYSVAKKYADSNEIKIFNATRGGKLEIFPRVDFDKIQLIK